MNKTRIAVKWFVGTIAATALVLGSLSAPAQAAPDTNAASGGDRVNTMRDTGWGPV
jgi:hypothetical protein